MTPKALKRRLSDDGLPVDGREWSEQDWRCLHLHLEAVKKEVSERHGTTAMRDLPTPQRKPLDVGVPDVPATG